MHFLLCNLYVIVIASVALSIVTPIGRPAKVEYVGSVHKKNADTVRDREKRLTKHFYILSHREFGVLYGSRPRIHNGL